MGVLSWGVWESLEGWSVRDVRCMDLRSGYGILIRVPALYKMIERRFRLRRS